MGEERRGGLLYCMKNCMRLDLIGEKIYIYIYISNQEG